MDWIREYILTLTGAGILCGIVKNFGQGKSGGKMLEYACGLFLILAAVLIAVGALFLIAPVWQWQRPAAAYVPAAVAQPTATPVPTIIDINTATAEELTALPGLGPEKAAALVRYREENGPFAALADAAAVK